MWAFKIVPTAIFCVSPTDQCSCTSGGFDIYSKVCAAVELARSNKTGSASLENETAAEVQALQKAKQDYTNVFDALEGQGTTIFMGTGIVFITFVVFSVRFKK